MKILEGENGYFRITARVNMCGIGYKGKIKNTKEHLI